MEDNTARSSDENLRVMSRDEAKGYQGLTLDADGNPEEEETTRHSGFTFKTISFGSLSWGQRLFWGFALLIIGILLFIAFIPVTICVLVALLLGFIFRRDTLMSWWEKGRQLLSLFRLVH